MNNSTQKSLGLSLIELMVALTIGSLLIIGAVTMYVQSRNTYSVNETVARLQENARYAMSMMEPDIRQANYWGLMNDPQLITGAVGNSPLAVPTGAGDCGADFPIDLQRPIAGDNAGYTLACDPGPNADSVTPADADTIIVRRAEAESVAAAGDRLQVYTTRQGGSSAVFYSASAPGALPAPDPVYGPSAEVHNLVARAYYVSQDSQQRAGLPSLRRQNLQGGPEIINQEIIPGVEDLQVQFGIDLGADDDGDGDPDDRDGNGRPDRYNGIASSYVNPGDPALAGAMVVAVRIWIRVRAENPEVGYRDDRIYSYADVNFDPAGADESFRRLIVSRTIQIRNTVSLQI